MTGFDVVVIGASWGGLKALSRLLPALPGDFPVPIVIAQHRDADSEDELLSKLLARESGLPVMDADDKAPLQPGTVLLAPPGYHLLLADANVELSLDAPVQFSRPSIDVLFESAAESYGARVVGVLLTGANADGARGLEEIHRRGGSTIVEDPETAERPEMPRAAVERFTPDHVVPLDAIAGLLVEACGKEVAS
jgi:two-component system, chemotaxis family, protein-glutamate methylesterase/glutaminase